MDAISITPDSTFEEFTRSVSAPLKPSAIRLPLQIASLLLGMGAVITLIETWGSFAGVAAVIAAISGLAIFVLSQSLASSRLKACYLAGKDDAATYAFSESGVTGACKCTRTDFSWAAFDRVLESETMYVLVTKSLACIRVPKRNIPSDRVDQFVALISERVGAPIQIK